MAIVLVDIQTTIEVEVDDSVLNDDSLVDYARTTAVDLIHNATRKYNTRFTTVQPTALLVGDDTYDLD